MIKIIIFLFLVVLGLFLNRQLPRNLTDQSENEPLLKEEALVHAKSTYPARQHDYHIIHFYISDRNTVVDCDVRPEVWKKLKKGQRGTLCHQGGKFYSFACDGTILVEQGYHFATSDFEKE